MRVAFLTNTSCRVNRPLREALLTIGDVQLCHVFLYDTFGEFKRHPLRSIRQFGWLPILRKALHRLAPGVNRQAASVPPTALQWCQSESIPHTVVANMNDASSVELLQSLQADVLLVCVCKNILRTPALSACKLGAVNIHPSLLPKYRGPCPTFWARYHEDERIGVTLHRMTNRIDCGAILGQFAMDANYLMSDDRIESDLFQLAADHLQPVLARLAAGDDSHEAPVGSNAPYYPFPTAAQRKEVARRKENASQKQQT